MNTENKGQKPEKLVTITVNTKDVTVTKDKYSYEEIVELAFPNPDYAAYTYKVTYFRHPDKDNPGMEGSLTKGESINVKDGMSFTVGNPVRS
jgi:hypothetical protein